MGDNIQDGKLRSGSRGCKELHPSRLVHGRAHPARSRDDALLAYVTENYVSDLRTCEESCCWESRPPLVSATEASRWRAIPK